ncbi:MRG/MORF4L-binding protein [Drosophila pseudoobscura]|uniref:MRG/MORF4L-binding protein n=1 Tax=Drosophila pseudoobscura pseudoobscura TaxID=46245 RepID=A0A6I8UVH4_DROPS|nr:MRG/MORF4L-binding protein [Drosophila pseudoobscura]
MMAKDKGMAGTGTAIPATGDREWSAEEELQLFHAMEGLRPVGINKHFYMSCIAQRLSKSLNREMPSELIWKHLGTMYKLKELDDLETLPFPNEEREFCLPEQEYGTLLTKKKVEVNSSEETTDGPASVVAPAPDSNGKAPPATTKAQVHSTSKDAEKKSSAKPIDLPKRPAKRTRGSMSNESISPSTTPPPVQSNKRRRI